MLHNLKDPCVSGVLLLQGSLPAPLAGIIVGRDVLLVTGALVDRARKVSWASVTGRHLACTCSSHASCTLAAVIYWPFCHALQMHEKGTMH